MRQFRSDYGRPELEIQINAYLLFLHLTSEYYQLFIQFLHFLSVFVMEDQLVVDENRGMEEPLLSDTDNRKGGFRTLPFIIGNPFL